MIIKDCFNWLFSLAGYAVVMRCFLMNRLHLL